ncbi:MAG TPA: SDR family NAD(P)-dependent oxidoreductase, partial [Ktedonobacterales bacterium]|nr:SDR family NAD(P)-dependent oxidoreductase [Ktedonobacterales bacterium]
RGLPPLHSTHYEQNNGAVVRLIGPRRKEALVMSYHFDQIPQYPDLAGKVAVVTGGSHGIGSVTCRILAANDAKVVVNGRDRDAIDTVVAKIRSEGGTAIGVAADCADVAAIERMRQQVEQELGPVNVLATFAGGPAIPAPTLQLTAEQWRSVVDSNLTATFLTLKSFVPGMIERQSGSVVTISSSGGRIPEMGAPAPYVAAKAGIQMLSRRLAGEVGEYGVRINCVAPASILTERVQRLMPEAQQQQAAASYPLRRLGKPEDVALAILFLASDASSWLTGVTLDVAGGRVML